MLLGFIIAYLIITLGIGWWASRRVKTARDFAVAGGRLPMVVAASALFATWFGSETIMGASSEFVDHGILGVIEDPFGAALCLLLIGLFYARPLYKLSLLTFNDYFRQRFSRRVELLSAIFMVPSYFGWIAAQLVALGILIHTLTGFPVLIGILMCAIIVVIYTYIGGMWAVSITDFVQTIVIIIGLGLLAIDLIPRAGGISGLVSDTPEGFFKFFPDGNFRDITQYFAAWITIGLGSIPQQDIFQRVMAAKSERTAVQASIFAAFLYLSIGFLPLLIGLSGKIIYPEIGIADGQMLLPQLVLEHGSLFVQILLFGALLSAILSTTSGAILAPATVLAENIIKPFLKDTSDLKLLRIMRLCVFGVALLSAILAGMNSNIYELVGTSSAFSLVSLFVPLTAGLYWKKATDAGAMFSIISGMGGWIYFETFPSEIPSLMLGLLFSTIGMLAGSLCFKKNIPLSLHS